MPSRPTASSAAHLERPENPPEFRRRIIFGRWQSLGLAVLLSMPLLALFGVLGDGEETLTASSRSASGQDALRLSVIAPVCGRYGNKLQLRLAVVGPQEIGSSGRRVRIELAADYMTRFTDVRSQPEIAETTARAFVVEQTLPVDGSAAPVFLELTPEHYGWAKGAVRVVDDKGAAAEVNLKTFIFP